MKKSNMDSILLGASVVAFLIMSVSFLLMPVEGLAFLPGVLFWGGLILGIVFQIVLEVRRRAFIASHKIRREKMLKHRIGLLTFGANKISIIADNIFVVSVVATILCLICTKGSGYLCYVFISTMCFSLCAHCIFSGRIYLHIKNSNRLRRGPEQKEQAIQTKEREKNEK